MKRYLVLTLFAAATLPAFLELSQDRREPEAPLVVPSLTSAEKSEILDLSSEILSHAVTFRGDGTASTTYFGAQDRSEIEWRELVIRQIVIGSVSEDDQKAGVGRRFYAQVGAKSFRTCQSGQWSAWKSGQCPFFPGYIVIEEIDGQLRASSPMLAKFLPGPRVNPNDPTRPLMPHERFLAQR